MNSQSNSFSTPREADLDLVRISNRTGMSADVLTNGSIFALQHQAVGGRTIMIGQVLGSPIAGGLGGIWIRASGRHPTNISALSLGLHGRFGAADDRVVWQGEVGGIRHEVVLWLHPDADVWFWRVRVVNETPHALPCDAVFVQDLGLGERGFLQNNEAYASQYIDHHIARHPRFGHVLMARQNMAQGGSFPWVAHGCLEGVAGFATDLLDVMGPAHRDADGFGLPFGEDLASQRLQHESACAALQSHVVTLAPGEEAVWTFFGCYSPNHAAASSDADLATAEGAGEASKAWRSRDVSMFAPVRSLLQAAPVVVADALHDEAIAARYRDRTHVETSNGQVLSFFTPAESHDRHVVLRDKERIVARRHGALLRSGDGMLPADDLLCATCWMHGVFGAQLTIGNTSFHKLFSVSRDPYNITRGSGLRILVELDERWHLLAVPSVFEIGLAECRWIYRVAARTITVLALVSSSEPAMVWRVSVEGEPCRLIVFGHLVLGDQELGAAGHVDVDGSRNTFVFRPDPASLWGQHCPDASYRLVSSTPDQLEAIGGDELLFADGRRRSGAYAVLRTRATNGLAFAVVGSMTDPSRADALAARYAGAIDHAAMAAQADRAWTKITRGFRVERPTAEARAIDTVVPWLMHDATIHCTVPHGLEQYSGAAWGTRDVCQGPLELMLSLEHDDPAKEIVRTVFAQQDEKRGDWPQWFMLDPYSSIQGREAHGDVIVWPLKALCDYIEATGDVGFLDEPVAWSNGDTSERTAHRDAVEAHVSKAVATIRESFIPGTHLPRYGNGDWNDSLQPVDPSLRDMMASSWTVALLYQQLVRYAEILRVGRRPDAAAEFDTLAAAMKQDFRGLLMRDGVVGGYGIFDGGGGDPELLLHPSDRRTGLSYSLIPMTQAIIGGLFTPDESRRHLAIIREHLLFPDGARLMDRPLPYHGGPETMFRRAESAAFFGREIGLMYVHAHLRYGEAMSVLREPDALWEALLVANPIAVTDRLPHASLRQRNAYFSSSDAAFRDRDQASKEWRRCKAAEIAVDGGWRIYSSGPGLYLYLLIQHAFGLRRYFGKRMVTPCLPVAERDLSVKRLWPADTSGHDAERATSPTA